MTIDTTRPPVDLFIDLMRQVNPSIPPITADDIAIRQITTLGGTSTSIQVDLLIRPSDVDGDFVEFTYNRVPIELLFGLLDDIDETADVEVHYDDSLSSAMASSIGQAEVDTVLSSYILSKYGVNIGTSGVTVTASGADQYTMSFDNTTYVGKLLFLLTKIIGPYAKRAVVTGYPYQPRAYLNQATVLHNGKMWLAHDKKLVGIDPNTYAVEVIDVPEIAVPTSGSNGTAFCWTPDNRLVLAVNINSNVEITVFPPNQYTGGVTLDIPELMYFTPVFALVALDNNQVHGFIKGSKTNTFIFDLNMQTTVRTYHDTLGTMQTKKATVHNGKVYIETYDCKALEYDPTDASLFPIPEMEVTKSGRACTNCTILSSGEVIFLAGRLSSNVVIYNPISKTSRLLTNRHFYGVFEDAADNIVFMEMLSTSSSNGYFYTWDGLASSTSKDYGHQYSISGNSAQEFFQVGSKVFLFQSNEVSVVDFNLPW